MGERKIALDFRSLPEGMRQCGKCRQIKHMSEFHKDRRRASGVRSSCKDCINTENKRKVRDPNFDHLTPKREYRRRNAEALREMRRAYKQRIKKEHALSEAQRRARKKTLPDNFTALDLQEVLYVFDGKCAITGDAYEHMDHFIPISSGFGGTVIGNMIPLSAEMNLSKGKQNPIEWAKTLDESKQERFKVVLAYLADENRMTVDEYIEYVQSCFSNEKQTKIKQL